MGKPTEPVTKEQDETFSRPDLSGGSEAKVSSDERPLSHLLDRSRVAGSRNHRSTDVADRHRGYDSGMKLRRRRIRRSAAYGTLSATGLWAALVASAASAPGDGPPSRPDVLMICVDDLNDWLGPLGGHPDVRTRIWMPWPPAA